MTSQISFGNAGTYIDVHFRCLSGSILESGKFILFKKTKMKFSEAEEFCDNLGLQLPIPESIAEASFFIDSLISKSDWMKKNESYFRMTKLMSF